MNPSSVVALVPRPTAAVDPASVVLHDAAAGAEIAGVAGRPLYGAAILAGWVLSGLVVALVLARRGHEAVPVAVLGVLTGPFLIGVARSNLIPREQGTDPLVIAEGSLGDGDEDALIVIGDGPPLDEAIAGVRSLGSRLRRVTLAHSVTFEIAWDDDDLARAARDDAAGVLDRAANRMPDIQPRLLLLPGAPRTAVEALATAEGIDHVLHAGSPSRRHRDRS